MNPTQLLRPVHAWFSLWDRAVPSVSRVVATALAALATAVALTAVGLRPLRAGPLSLAAWIGVAIAQEHDQRVHLPPDRAFIRALADAVSAPPLDLTIGVAHGPRRARPEPWDTSAVLKARDTEGGDEGHPLRTMYISVERSADSGWMRLRVSDDAGEELDPIEERLRARSQSTLARRITQARSPEADARAVAAALIAAHW